MVTNDDGPGRPVSRDEPYYPLGQSPGPLFLGQCNLCNSAVPGGPGDYRHGIMRAIKAGWKLDKSGPEDVWTCPACAAVARANLDAACREEAFKEGEDGEAADQ